MTLNQSATNKLIFYVKSGLNAPYYLVNLVNKINDVNFAFIVTDLASCDFITAQMVEPGRLGADDPTNGTIKLDTGSFELYLYDQTSSTNLDPTLTNSLLLNEDCYVYSDNDPLRTFA